MKILSCLSPVDRVKLLVWGPRASHAVDSAAVSDTFAFKPFLVLRSPAFDFPFTIVGSCMTATKTRAHSCKF